MAFASFNKSNWSRMGAANPSVVYSPVSQAFGIPASSIPANTTSVITYSVPRKFKGNGPIEISVPAQTLAASGLQSGLSLGEAVLLCPAAASFGTSYAAGTLPKIQFKVCNSTVGALTPTTTDLIFTQY